MVARSRYPKLVSPVLIPEVWPDILPGLQTMQKKAGGDSPDTIQKRLVEHEAFLFTVPEGFFVLLPVARAQPSVLVWAAYGVGGGLIQKYEPVISALARKVGAFTLEFESPRPGYRRALKHWKRTGNRYTRRLT